MAIRFLCPEGHRLKAVGAMAGRDMLCPVCHAPVRVPAAGPREGELEPAADAGAETAPGICPFSRKDGRISGELA
ncbi:MAG: hypothetical protein PHN77_23015, partial [Thermoguttaceae bacterium]|nr:hypothetical protein [Thermoguttaceae bacterium]